MKKLLSLILFTTSILNQAQTYSFDYSLQLGGVEKESQERIGNTLMMINSKDPHYDIIIEDGISGVLSNYNQSKIYRSSQKAK